MRLFLFASQSHRNLSAFTRDRQGANLPVEYAPWRVIKSDKPTFTGAGHDPIAAGVARRGYFLISGRTHR